jgi:hypothetical protein
VSKKVFNSCDNFFLEPISKKYMENKKVAWLDLKDACEDLYKENVEIFQVGEDNYFDLNLEHSPPLYDESPCVKKTYKRQRRSHSFSSMNLLLSLMILLAKRVY